MARLSGKRIIIAGGATGIGAATAERLAAEGAQLIIGDINEAALKATVQKLETAGCAAQAVVFDLTDQSSITALIDACATRYGGIDGLINVGADVEGGRRELDEDILDLDVAKWEKTFRVNLIGYALTARAVIPHMVRGGGGAIVHISSLAAFDGQPRIPAYQTSKVALHALSRHIARRWGKDGIRSNCVAPGYVLTDATLAVINNEELDKLSAALPLPRLGKASDIAAGIAYLISDDSSWVTGQVLSVNGGQVFRD
jgi:NAD(P)-dependent dehydrogenase (short-subunit alcohol dehydrogenase family)